MMNRLDKATVLQNADVPVLFILGEEDAAAPIDIVIKQVQLPSNAHIHILDNVGHMSMLEAPDKLNKFIHEFAHYAGGHKD
jgi:pimeloyl-ACP methyl ester carboxylesterase